MFVLDTNTLIYFFKGMGHVSDRLLATPPHQIAVPTIVLFELETGITKSAQPMKRRRQLDAMLSVVEVLPFGLEEARVAASIRAHLESVGTPIGPLDVLIAAVARAQNAPLVTHNTKEFKRVPGLVLEDWF